MSKSKSKRRPPRRRKPAAASSTRIRGENPHLRFRPTVGEGEHEFDAAVVDNAALKQIDVDSQRVATAIRDALDRVEHRRDAEAVELLLPIPRSSTASDWVLLIRGLIDWYGDKTDLAKKAWSRLDTARRPHRIAIALQSIDSSATQLSADISNPAATDWIRHFRHQRPAIDEARQGLQLPEARQFQRDDDVPEQWVGPVRLKWLIEFVSQYRRLEPELVAALQTIAIQWSCAAPYSEVVDDAARALKGPIHDPNSLLMRSIYHGRFQDGDSDIISYRNRYLKDLSNNNALSSAVRHAIASEVWLQIANDAQSEYEQASMPFGFGRRSGTAEDMQAVQKAYQAAITAYPGSEHAHTRYTNWLVEIFVTDQDKPNRNRRDPKQIETWTVDAMTAWSKAIPDAVPPRLWLVDHHLENESLELAASHVKWLSESRHPDPLVRGTPWRWEILEAFRLCRRKAWLDQVYEHLARAGELWPEWVQPDWQKYLAAGLLVRMGRTKEAMLVQSSAKREMTERLQPSLPTCDPEDFRLADAVMMLGAAQRMRVDAKALKPFRDTVDAAVADCENLRPAELLHAGSFFLDLHRTNLLYPAYRRHGAKLGDELIRRFNRKPNEYSKWWDTVQMHRAIGWLASRNLFYENNIFKLPKILQTKVDDHHQTVIELASLFQRRSPRYELGSMKDRMIALREAAKDFRDPFERFSHAALAERGLVEERELGEMSGGMFGQLASIFGGLDPSKMNLDNFDFEDLARAAGMGFDDDEDECDCPDCVRRRAQQAARAEGRGGKR